MATKEKLTYQKMTEHLKLAMRYRIDNQPLLTKFEEDGYDWDDRFDNYINNELDLDYEDDLFAEIIENDYDSIDFKFDETLGIDY